MTLPVAVKVEQAAERQEAAVQTRDVSSTGVYFEFSSELETGTPLEFVLTLPEEVTKGSSVRIKCLGKVVRVDRGSAFGKNVGVAATIERYEFLRES